MAERLFRKAGFDVIYPRNWPHCAAASRLKAKGSCEAADRKWRELEAALREASGNGHWPIVFDTSPCALPDEALSRRAAHGARQHRVHSRCRAAAPCARAARMARSRSIRSAACARWARSTSWLRSRPAAAAKIVLVQDVLCCGFAGEKGFNRPELNEYALRHFEAALPAACTVGYSSSRTCEIGLSEQAGFPYCSHHQPG